MFWDALAWFAIIYGAIYFVIVAKVGMNMHIIAKMFLERFTAVSKARAILTYHHLLSTTRITNAKMTPHAQANGCLMLGGILTNTPTGLSAMFHSRLPVQMPHQQAAQAAAV